MMTGGVADVYLDGELHRTVDVYSDGVGCRNSEAVWHAFGLADEEHTLRVVVRGGRRRISEEGLMSLWRNSSSSARSFRHLRCRPQ